MSSRCAPARDASGRSRVEEPAPSVPPGCTREARGIGMIARFNFGSRTRETRARFPARARGIYHSSQLHVSSTNVFTAFGILSLGLCSFVNKFSRSCYIFSGDITARGGVTVTLPRHVIFSVCTLPIKREEREESHAIIVEQNRSLNGPGRSNLDGRQWISIATARHEWTFFSRLREQ